MPDNGQRRRGPRSLASRIKRKPDSHRVPEPEPEIQPLGLHEHVEKFFRASPNTVDKWIKNEGLPCIRIGGLVRFDMQSVRSWALRRQLQTNKSEEKAEETA
jgi:hypothetical protein